MKFEILSMRYDGIYFRSILRMFVISFFWLSPLFVQVMAFVIERQQIIQFHSSFLSSITDGTHDENEKCSNDANIQLTDDPTSKIFLDWMYHQRGCQGEEDAVKILVNEQTGHRGLYVTKDVAEGDYIFAIPFQSAWIVEKEEEDGKNKEKMAEELSDAERGLRFLMWQRRLRDTESQDDDDDNNNWKPYLEILPTYNNGIHDIASWTTEQIASLELPPIIQRALSKKQNVEELASQNEKTVHLNELRFATWLVNSRAITVIVDDDDDDDYDDYDDDDDDDYDDDDDDDDDNDDNDDGIENDNERDDEEENDDRNDDENKNISTNCVLVPLLDMINHSSEKPNAYYSVLGLSLIHI